MNNRPVERHQADEQQDEYNAMTARSYDPDEDRTRQEFKDDADVSKILRRFGVNGNERIPVYGQEINYDIDLHGAYQAVEAAQRTFRGIPDELLDTYPTWQAMLTGMATGRFGHDLAELKATKAAERKAKREASQKGDTAPVEGANGVT